MRSVRVFALLVAVLSGLAASPAAASTIVAKVSITDQTMDVYVDGWPEYSWPVSTARRGYYTPTGVFHAQRLAKIWYSKKYDNSPMPHSIFFTQKGHAIHGTYEAKHLGSPVSHGCVRISTAHATELFAMVKSEGMSNTKVIVTGGGSEDLVAKRNAPELQDPNGGPDWNARLGDSVEMPTNRIFFTPRY